MPGMEETSFLMPLPKAENMGYTRSLTDSVVSRTIRLKVSLPRILRALNCGKNM